MIILNVPPGSRPVFMSPVDDAFVQKVCQLVRLVIASGDDVPDVVLECALDAKALFHESIISS